MHMNSCMVVGIDSDKYDDLLFHDDLLLKITFEENTEIRMNSESYSPRDTSFFQKRQYIKYYRVPKIFKHHNFLDNDTMDLNNPQNFKFIDLYRVGWDKSNSIFEIKLVKDKKLRLKLDT